MYSTNLKTIFDINILLIGLSDGSVQILPCTQATAPGDIEEQLASKLIFFNAFHLII